MITWPLFVTIKKKCFLSFSAVSIIIWTYHGHVYHVLGKYYKFPVCFLYFFRYGRRNVLSINFTNKLPRWKCLQAYEQHWKVIYCLNRWNMMYTKDSNIDSYIRKTGKYFGWWYSAVVNKCHVITLPDKHVPVFP